MKYQLLGDSIQIKELNGTIAQVAPTDISVLITGESGTGKELIANAIYRLSNRKDKPMVTVNCGAIPEGIIESELFGHEKGSFTGATGSREGYFETADGGTVFLDEIGDMPLHTQVKILRVLESGEFMRVGGNKNIKVDVRVIAATNKDLAKEALNKNFREDLYFRLKSINLHIPPLRERKSDVKVLFDFFVKNFCKKNNITFQGIEEDAMQYLTNYAWVGNARELKNFVESIIVLYPEKRLTIEDVKKHLQPAMEIGRSLPVLFGKEEEKTGYDKDILLRAMAEIKSDVIDIKNFLNKQQIENYKNRFQEDDFIISKEKMSNINIDELEKEAIRYLLNENNWNVSKVSEILGQSPRNIYRKISKFNIEKED